MSFTSTLTPRLVNEFRAGAQRARIQAVGPWDSDAGLKQLPTVGGLPYVVDFSTVTDPIVVPGAACCGYGYIAPLYNWSDNLSWIKGRHAFKGGVEVRFVSSGPYSAFEVMPRAIIGSGGAAVTGLTAANIPTLGTNEGDAQSLLLNLAGSLTGVNESFNSAPPPDLEYKSYQNKVRHWKQREFSVFFKDDFKVRTGLTLNLGVRYEFYGVPYERRGQTAAIVGGGSGLFGISGTSWADMYQPFHAVGKPTQIELVGKNSPNPDKLIYDNDFNNFGPAVGLSWSSVVGVTSRQFEGVRRRSAVPDISVPMAMEPRIGAVSRLGEPWRCHSINSLDRSEKGNREGGCHPAGWIVSRFIRPVWELKAL